MDFGAASALHQAWPSFTSPLLSPSQEAIAIIIPTAKFHTHHFWWPLSEIILICVTSVSPLPTCWPCYLCEQPFAIPAWICDSSYCCWWHCGSQVGERSFKSFSTSVVTQSLLCLCCAVLCCVVLLDVFVSCELWFCCGLPSKYNLVHIALMLGCCSSWGTWCATAIWDRISALSYWHSHLSQWVILLPFLLSSPVISASSTVHCKLSPSPPPSLSKGVSLVN